MSKQVNRRRRQTTRLLADRSAGKSATFGRDWWQKETCRYALVVHSLPTSYWLRNEDHQKLYLYVRPLTLSDLQPSSPSLTTTWTLIFEVPRHSSLSHRWVWSKHLTITPKYSGVHDISKWEMPSHRTRSATEVSSQFTPKPQPVRLCVREG